MSELRRNEWRRTARDANRRLAPTVAVALFALSLTAPTARGQYTEAFQTWSATADATWEEKDLSGSPFNVVANAVVEIAVYNTKDKNARQGGVRAVGSGLARFFDLMEAEKNASDVKGTDVVVMHVQADANGKIEIYAEKKNDITFVLLGYWCIGTYVETFPASFSAGADATWTNHSLNTYGVSASEIAEIVMVNTNTGAEKEAGVRTNGSSLERRLDLHESEGDGGTSENATMFVKADGTGVARIELYAETDADVDFYIVGYWSTPPGSYTELFADIGSPSADGVWEDIDLTADGLPDDAIAEIVLTNQFATAPNEMGVRTNGSSLARLLDLQEAEDGGEDAGRMHVMSDSTATIEFYHEDVSDAHRFLLTGYWDNLSTALTLADHVAGQETNAFGSCPGSVTDAELFGFQFNPCGGSITVTQLVFRLTSITGIVNGDWAGIEIIEDTNDDGNIGVGETTAVGGAGVVNTAAGTITFSTSFAVTGGVNYILRADVSSLAQGDTVTIGLAASDVSTAGTETGSTTSVTHITAADLATMDYFGKFNDASGTTARDSSGNGNDGTVTGASWTTGLYGGALSFDGTGDYVDIPTTVGSTTAGSISFWFLTSTDFASDAMLYYGSDAGSGNGGGNQNELHVNFTSSETIQFFIEGTPDVSITSSGTYADGAWHNVLATWDITGNAVLYIDGTSIGSATHDADSFSFSSTHRVGRPGANSNLFTGRIDNVRLYASALESTQATTLSRGYGLVAHWKLDTGSGTNAVDSTGNADGTLTNGPVWVDDGRQCKALDFDGDNDHITFPHNADMSLTSFTLSAWINSDTVANGYRGIVSKGTSADDWNYWLGMDTDEISFGFYNGTDWPDYLSTSNLSVDTWYHFAATFDNTTDEIFLYLNGAQVLSTTTTDTPTTNLEAGWIGTDQENKDWNGEIDDVRIYNRALTPSEIQSLAARYHPIDLGSLNGERSLGISVNNFEQVAGFDQASADGAESAWVSEYCIFTALGTLGSGADSAALDINDSGTACGWSHETDGDRKAFSWTSGGGLVDLGALAGTTDSEGTGINASGQICGTSLNFGAAPTDWEAFIYLPVGAYSLSAGMNSLGTLGGGYSIATDINDSGEVVGGAANGDDNFVPFIWLPSAAYSLSAGMNALGTLGNFDRGITERAQAINASGETVGRSFTAGGDGHAFIWLPSAAHGQGAGITDLGVLTGGDDSWAFDVNVDGEVVGTSNVTGGAFHAFIWQDGTMTDLNNLIDSASGWTLTRAVSINDDGEIVGFGTNSCSDVRAFMLIQSCSTAQAASGAGAAAAAGFLVVEFEAEAADDGVVEEVLLDDKGTPLAKITIVNAAPGAEFNLSIKTDGLNPTSTAPSFDGPSIRRPDSDVEDEAPRLLDATISEDPIGTPSVPPVGFADGIVVDRTVTLEASRSPGDFIATVEMIVAHDELDAIGMAPEDLALHVFDVADLRWAPADGYIGEAEPTGFPGQSGFMFNVDDTVTYWVVLGKPGLFAVGAVDESFEPDPDTPPDLPRPRVCGLGAMQFGLMSFAGLMLISTRRRRFI